MELVLEVVRSLLANLGGVWAFVFCWLAFHCPLDWTLSCDAGKSSPSLSYH
jgi:hypothetical protein